MSSKYLNEMANIYNLAYCFLLSVFDIFQEMENTIAGAKDKVNRHTTLEELKSYTITLLTTLEKETEEVKKKTINYTEHLKYHKNTSQNVIHYVHDRHDKFADKKKKTETEDLHKKAKKRHRESFKRQMAYGTKSYSIDPCITPAATKTTTKSSTTTTSSSSSSSSSSLSSSSTSLSSSSTSSSATSSSSQSTQDLYCIGNFFYKTVDVPDKHPGQEHYPPTSIVVDQKSKVTCPACYVDGGSEGIFSQLTKYQTHVKYTHRDQKAFKCLTCDNSDNTKKTKLFDTPDKIRQHINKVHIAKQQQKNATKSHN